MASLVRRLEAVLIVGIGGFAGASSRHIIEIVVPGSLVGTALVNVLGCLVLGFVFYDELYDNTLAGPTRTILATGFIASFTTYSTFVIDAVTAPPAVGIAYVAGNYALGFFAVVIGRAGARRVARQSKPEVSRGD